MNKKRMIAERVAKEFVSGTFINLGAGIPALCAEYIPRDMDIMFQSENGFIGIGPMPPKTKIDKDCINASGTPVTILPGGSYFDSVTSFSIIRGRHIHTTVLGALQVDQRGNFANWMIPNGAILGMGGAMDLAISARRVIIAMKHVTKDGSPKILKECRFPLTGVGVVDLIVTDMAVIEVTKEGLVLKEVAPGLTVENVIKATEAELLILSEVKAISF